MDEEDGASGDFTVGIAAGCMSVEASVAVVVNEGRGEGDFIVRGIGSDFGDFGDFGVEFGDVKSSEARFELVFKVGFGLGDEFIFFGDVMEEGSKDCDVFGVF